MPTDKPISDLFETILFIIFAVAALRVIAPAIADLEGDTTNFSATEIIVIGFITTIIVLGIAYRTYLKFF